MGLDPVELVIELEDEFKITISDARAEKCETVGQVYDMVLELLAAKFGGQGEDWEAVKAHVWKRVVQLSHDHVPDFPIELIARDTHYIHDLGF